MMSAMFMLAWLWLGLVSRGLADSLSSPSASLLKDDATVVKLQRMERTLLSVQQALQSSHSVMGFTRMEVMALYNKLVAFEKKTDTKLEALELLQGQLKAKPKGSTFVRWGSRNCTDKSRLVYSGAVGGSYYSHYGGAANHLCLTMAPQFDNTPVPGSYSFLYGAEYEVIPQHQNQNVPCSLCMAAKSTTVMVPGTHTCPEGWTPQYTGHLAAGHYNHKSATQYVCLDGDLEDMPGGAANHEGALLYYTITQCGSLSCPPYVNKKVVLCVVCSK
ncbi:short-chain collagen C4-like [Babylonia areolata]|uniref:short-chain collagen C4-like n=1 Tax=Babylonia areolata TaxID=304850 RepID=UPI003FD2BC1C